MINPVLIVEDEVKIAGLLRDYCEQFGYTTLVIHDGDEAVEWLKINRPRIVLLDLMLPGTDGLTICRELRRNSDVPVIMITARIEEIDRLLGLELGADDYICKPFSPREVIARIKNILRRAERVPVTDSRLKLDESSYRVLLNDKCAELTSVEFRLFKTLYDSPGRIYSRDHLMSLIYRDNRIVTERTIDSHIKKLRKKIQQLGIPEDPIHSIYGVGYRFE